MGAQRASVSCTTFARPAAATKRRTNRDDRRFRRFGPVAALLLVLGLVTSCAEEEAGPVFANQTPPTSTLPTPFPSPTAASAATATAGASPVAERDVLLARGAPSRFYFRVGRELWTMADGGDVRRVLAPAPDEEIRATAASPSGDRVAAILTVQAAGGERASVVVVDAEGREVQRIPAIEAALGPSRPRSARANSLDWAPQGGRLLVTFSPGGLVALPAEGRDDPIVLVGEEATTSPAAGAWAPTGEAIAFLDPAGGAAPTGLLTATIAPDTAPPAAVWSPAPGRSVTGFAWTADGRALLVAEGTASGSPAGVGNLWLIFRVGDRRLVASGGVAGPVAAIVDLAPSPNGRAVAYTVAVPEESGARFHSLWVRDLTTDHGDFEILVPSGQSVTELWWTSAGLVFRVVPTPDVAGGDSTSFALYLANGGGAPIRIFDGTAQTGGTPGASPAGPAGTPEVVPASTPFGG